jgi:hypothetical protein
MGQDALGTVVTDNLARVIPQIQEMNPQFAAAFQNALVDPLTGQERPVEQQMQRILDIFYKAPDEFGAMIDLMDANGNRIPDIMEQDLVTPVEESRAQILEDFNAIPPGASTAASTAGSNFRSAWQGGMSNWNPGAPLVGKLQTIPPLATTTGGTAASGFSSGWTSNWGRFNPASEIQPKLNEIPPIANTAGAQATSQFGNGLRQLPINTQGTVTETGNKFQALHQAIDTERAAIFTSLGQISVTIFNWQTAVGDMLALMDLSTPMKTAIDKMHNTIILELGEVMTAWLLHFQALNSTIPVQLGLTAQTFTQYMSLVNTAVIMGLGTVMASWMLHFQALNSTVGIQLGLTAQVFTQYMALVNTAVILGLGNVMLSWVNHFTALNTMVSTRFATIVGTFNTWMALAATQVLTQTTAMSAYWMIHANSVGATIAAINARLGQLNAFTAATAGSVLTQTTNMSVSWASHASSVGSTVGTLQSHMARYQAGVQSARGAINTQTTQMSAHWLSHSNSVRGTLNTLGNAIRSMVSNAQSQLRSLASTVGSTMRSISSDMARAKSAADALRRSIDALKSKTITVRTNYVSSGSPPRRARGGIDVVTRPQDIHVGEGGRPELVQVTPLQGTAGAHLNGLAALRTSMEGTMRAAGGATVIANNNSSRDGTQTVFSGSRHDDYPGGLHTSSSSSSPPSVVRRPSIMQHASQTITTTTSTRRSSKQVIEITSNLVVDGRVIAKVLNKHLNEGYTGMR